MKNALKLGLVAFGFCLAIIASSTKASAVGVGGGACVGDETRKCGTTAGGTTVYGYWTEAS